MIHILDKHSCCGCEACVQTCPKHCISFEEDEEGFRYPEVDGTSCIDCGLCEKVCPVLHQAESITPLHVYAAKNKCEEELMASSSGGLFILIAKKIISEGGVVFGAKFNEKWEVEHAYAETEEGLKAFMGSKYVQSRIGNCYKEAKTFLLSRRKVLFTGTSCQIAGLKNFLGKDYDNLLTVDVICHGVPSPKVWRKYLEEMKDKARRAKNSVSFHSILSSRKAMPSDGEGWSIEGISFRDKRLGWKKYSFVLTLAESSDEGKQNTVSFSRMHREDSYMRLFLSDLILRPSCYQCPAKGGKSQSDLTIADFWGIEKILPDFYDERGVGLFIVNTSIGQGMLESVTDRLYLVETAQTDSVANISSWYSSVVEPAKREKFWHLFNQGLPVCRIARRLVPPLSFLARLKMRVKRKLKKWMKK